MISDPANGGKGNFLLREDDRDGEQPRLMGGNRDRTAQAVMLKW